MIPVLLNPIFLSKEDAVNAKFTSEIEQPFDTAMQSLGISYIIQMSC